MYMCVYIYIYIYIYDYIKPRGAPAPPRPQYGMTPFGVFLSYVGCAYLLARYDAIRPYQIVPYWPVFESPIWENRPSPWET